MSRLSSKNLLSRFSDWATAEIDPRFPTAKSGVSDPDMENTAWINFDLPRCIAAIKLWDTGDFYLEILTLESEEPVVAEFGKIGESQSFSEAFSDFLIKVETLV